MSSKVLIIKLGFEASDPGTGYAVSLGAVLHATTILHLFKKSHVTWLAHRKALPLLEGNPHIDRILPYGLVSILQLKSETYDTVVNLERVPGICALADSIEATIRYGFCFNRMTGDVVACAKSLAALFPYLGAKADYLEIEPLFAAVCGKWRGERYVLGYRPKEGDLCDVGLNYLVGPKWPNKAWPQSRFIQLERKLRVLGYSVSWQKGENNLREYMDWINGCGVVVTNDSLGMHLAIALGRKVVTLFGPTFPHHTHLYGLGSKVSSPGNCDRTPCYEPVCKKGDIACMEGITVEEVLVEVEKLL